jgi:hypothetical protein
MRLAKAMAETVKVSTNEDPAALLSVERAPLPFKWRLRMTAFPPSETFAATDDG